MAGRRPTAAGSRPCSSAHQRQRAAGGITPQRQIGQHLDRARGRRSRTRAADHRIQRRQLDARHARLGQRAHQLGRRRLLRVPLANETLRGRQALGHAASRRLDAVGGNALGQALAHLADQQLGRQPGLGRPGDQRLQPGPDGIQARIGRKRHGSGLRQRQGNHELQARSNQHHRLRKIIRSRTSRDTSGCIGHHGSGRSSGGCVDVQDAVLAAESVGRIPRRVGRAPRLTIDHKVVAVAAGRQVQPDLEHPALAAWGSAACRAAASRPRTPAPARRRRGRPSAAGARGPAPAAGAGRPRGAVPGRARDDRQAGGDAQGDTSGGRSPGWPRRRSERPDRPPRTAPGTG